MAKVDFQEFLNEEIIESNKYNKDKNLEMLIEILEKKAKESKKDFMEEFQNNLKVSKKKSYVLQNELDDESQVESATSENNIIEDDEDILISDMIKQNVSDKEQESKKHESETENIEIAETEDISEEELEEKYPQDDLTINQKKYVYIYENAMKEYYKLKINLERQNIKDGEVCYDDRNFLKLMRLKDVAVKSELWFRNSTKGKFIGEAVPEIAEMENNNERECAEYQRQNNKDHEKANEKINQIKNELEECMDEINSLIAQMSELDEVYDSNLAKKLQEKSEKYIELNEKMEMLIPNPLKLAREEEKSIQQDELMTYHADEVKQRKSTSVDAQVLRNQKKYENQEENLDENGTNEVLNNLTETQDDTKEKFEKLIKEAIDKGDYNEAVKLNETYAEIMTQDINSSDDKEVIKTSKDFAEEIDNKIKEEKNIDSKEYVIVMSDANLEKYPPKTDVGENEFKNRLKDTGVNSPEEIATEDNLKERIEQIEDISKGKNVSKTNEEKSYESNNNEIR